MNLAGAIANGFGEIWSHKLRSLLTLVCVLLGVASLVLVQGFIDGLFDGWRSSIEENGGIQRIRIMTDTPPESQKARAGISPGLSIEDAKAIQQSALLLDGVTPMADQNDALFQRGRKSFRCRDLVGGWPEIFQIRRLELGQGRAFGDLDEQTAAQVVVLGAGVAKALFEEGEDPVGKTVDLRGVPFTVIGVLRPYEKWYGTFNLLREKNETALVPLSSLMRRISGNTVPQGIEVQAASVEDVTRTAAALESLLVRLHRGIEDVRVISQDMQVATFREQKRAFMIGGMAIAAVSLLVSGIGIMNLMLAAIHERVREIGVRKALGAWSRDIFVQFVVESCTLSVCGGLVGIGLGFGLISLLQGNETIRPIFSVNAALVGFAFSVTVGVLAGLYPALKASRLDPIEALRYD
jgi:ABC-type antimicrobial peptide transport system permease subunit